jgi:hypothetical protein
MTTIHSKSKVAAHATKSSTEPEAGTTVASLAPPPANAVIPSPNPGFVGMTGAQFVGITPKSTELSSLPLAIQDLQRFAAYAQTLGTTAPSYDQVLDVFTVANEWSTMRVATAAWDGYCVVQEGIAWRSMRMQMERLRPAFDLAVAGDPTIATQFPGLASFLGAKRAIARKSAATRLANNAAEANGEAPFHGTTGKKRKKAAEKAALVATAASPATPSVTAAPVETNAPHS